MRERDRRCVRDREEGETVKENWLWCVREGSLAVDSAGMDEAS